MWGETTLVPGCAIPAMYARDHRNASHVAACRLACPDEASALLSQVVQAHFRSHRRAAISLDDGDGLSLAIGDGHGAAEARIYQ